MDEQRTAVGTSDARAAPLHLARRGLRRRRMLQGAAALSSALLLASCDREIPLLEGSRPAGSCLGPEDEIPEEALREYSSDIIPSPVIPDPDVRFESRQFAISPDGSMLAACETFDRRALELTDVTGIVVWDTASGEVIRRIVPPSTGMLAWHPDGTRLAIGTSRIISLVDLEGNLQGSLLGHELPESGIATLRALAFSPDGRQLASSTSDESVRLWDVSGDSCRAGHILEPERLRNGSLSYSPDGTVLAVGGASTSEEVDSSHAATLWDPTTGERRGATADVPGVVHDLGHTADGSLVVVADEPPSLTVLAPDGTIEQGPVTASTWFAHLAVGPEQNIALLGADNELLLWDRATGEESRPEVPEGTGTPLWKPDGSGLYMVSAVQGPMAWNGERWRAFELPES